jgi:hypothetical protein
MKITEKIVDAVTGEETIIERDETAEESKRRLEIEGRNAAIAAHEKERNEKRQAVLDKLGLTADEAAALLG